MKKCSKCDIIKGYELFNKHSGKRDGYASNCKECDKQSRIDRAAKIREYNKTEGRKNGFKEYKKRNEEYYREYGRVYNSVYIYTHKEQRRIYDNEYRKNRYKTDPLFRCKVRCRSRINSFYKSSGFKRSNTTQDMIGCSWEFLVEYLENKFCVGMTHGNYCLWHIDHIIPLDSAKSEEDVYRLCHYTNLQPMWGFLNVRKSNMIL